MGRSGFVLLVIVAGVLGFTSCGSGNGTTVVAEPVPTSIAISPSLRTTMELGKTLSFTSTQQNSTASTVATVQFVSSNTSVVSVANSGLACAGTWDSLSNPQICTPGQTGVAQITAQAQGISSPATTVYVHQHIDKILITPAPSQPALIANCISKGQTFLFQANAFSLGTDITSTVGPFTWSSANSTLMGVANLLPGLPINQAQTTAGVPGITTITASVGNTNSIATPVTICPVRSISLVANGGSNTDLTVPVGTSINASATVIDAAGNTIVGVPLTWSSSNAISVGVTGSNTTAVINTTLAGGSTIVASCTPPSCNAGFQPSEPVYSSNLISVAIGLAGTTPSNTIYVTSDGCANAAGCVSTVVPISSTGSSDSPANSIGDAIALTATPNSFVFPTGVSAGTGFLGTDFSQQGTKGLMTLNSSNTGSQFTSAPGKVLAVSPDGTKVIVSDTADSPNQLFLFNVANSVSTPFTINGATVAAFSPDSMKAFVLAGSNLYVFSTQDAEQIIPLGGTGNNVAFIPEGGFAYVGTGSTLTPWQTCSDTSTPGQAVTTNSTPQFLQSLNTVQLIPIPPPPTAPPDSQNFDQIQSLIAVDSPGIDLITTQVNLSSPPPTLLGSCALKITSNPTSTVAKGFFNLGRGSFTPKQFLVASDASKAYIVTQELPVILVFDLNTHTSSAIPLNGGATPLAAALTPDAGSLYVGASDGQVHVVNTGVGVDIQQITFPDNFCRDSVGNSLPTPCPPDIIAVRQ
jgi:hypothetical protein